MPTSVPYPSSEWGGHTISAKAMREGREDKSINITLRLGYEDEKERLAGIEIQPVKKGQGDAINS